MTTPRPLSQKSLSRLRPGLALVGLAFALTSCVTIDKTDVFPVAGKTLQLSSLQALTDRQTEITSLPVAVAGRTVAAYYVRHPSSTGVLIFFGGSDNQVDATIKVVGKRTEALHLDLVVFYYYQKGEPVPSVTRIREEEEALYQAVRHLPSLAARSVYLAGYSLGGWFALDLAAHENVSGLILVGAETTPREVIRRTYAPWANLIAIQPDADTRQLDAALYAPRVRSRTLLVTSRQDEEVPFAVGNELFGLLPKDTPKRLVVLQGFTHGRYFLSDELWRAVQKFFGLPLEEVPRQ